jgi:hypothetical protein
VTNTRNDVHRPADFVPENYEYVGFFDNHPEPGSFIGNGGLWGVDGTDELQPGTNPENANYRYLRGLLEESETARYGDGFQCDHCGARIRYVAVFKHLPTTSADFAQMRRRSEFLRGQHRIVTARLEWVAADTTRVGVLGGLMEFRVDSEFFASLLGAVRKYGTLTERQESAARSALMKFYARRSTPRVEVVKVDVPTGRMTVTGKVLKVAYYPGFRDEVLKMTVDDDRGFRVFGTVPASLHWNATHECVARGERVTFTADLSPSRNDPAFGYFKRPRDARNLTPTVPTEGA